MKSQKVLVTGATDFVGANLVRCSGHYNYYRGG